MITDTEQARARENNARAILAAYCVDIEPGQWGDDYAGYHAARQPHFLDEAAACDPDDAEELAQTCRELYRGYSLGYIPERYIFSPGL